jgi:hypothetical protein
MRRSNQALILSSLTLLLVLCATAHAGESVWSAASFSVGAQGRWLDGITTTANADLELAGNAAISLTPHVSITGGVAYGLGDQYGRAQADARICATDVDDPAFNAWIGVGRYFSKRSTDGLDEWAGKSGIGWHPIKLPDGKPRPWLLGLTAAVGLETNRPSLTLFGGYAFKAAKGGAE